ncbi:flagellar filament capping protein FliD [Romboutsia sp.]|uniref:flagellar filament capping protein FliD n=1 Tax=Romboutsia sp. TaxID=1965302 RepID=UPI003F3D8315
MSSVSGIRLPGLATGMDTEAMVKEMLTGEQNKIDKVKQKEQTVKWQQEIYREVIKDINGFQDKYFSLSSKNSILNSSAWNTLTVNSSNSNIITATGTAGANSVNYKFEIGKLAQPARATSSVEISNGSKTSLKELGLPSEGKFKIELGTDEKGETIYSKEITIMSEATYKKGNGDAIINPEGGFKDEDGNKVDENGFLLDEKNEKIVEFEADTIDSLVKKINDVSEGKVKASYSDMTGKFTIESSKTGASSGFKIVGTDGNDSDVLDFLGLQGNSKSNKFMGSNAEIKVESKDGSFSKVLNEEINSFTIDGIKYDIHAVGTSEITSKQDVQPVIDNMKSFVEDYNKIIDKMYDMITQKQNRDYPPLTEAQKKDMSKEEIESWEKKAKVGLLRNDSEMRRFMDDMQKAIFGDNMSILNETGLTSHEDYTKKGQIALDEDKFRKALESDTDKVYEMFAKDSSSVMESMKSTMNKYVGGSSSVFAKKAGLEKTASAANNFYSEQLKRQAETIKMLQRKMSNKENDLYKKFGSLEASMNKLNSQMNYFAQM